MFKQYTINSNLPQFSEFVVAFVAVIDVKFDVLMTSCQLMAFLSMADIIRIR